MTNKEIARYLKQTADLIEVTGGNSFRSRAFYNASRIIDRQEEPVLQLVARNELTSVPGIGKGLAQDVAQLLSEGTFSLREQLLNTIPPGLLDVLRVKGLGPKKVRFLWQTLNITTLEALETAAKTDQLSALKGFGAKTQANILENVSLLKQYQKQRRYATAYLATEPFLNDLREVELVFQAELTGSLRRQLETVGDIGVLVATENPQGITTVIQEYFEAFDVSIQDEGLVVPNSLAELDVTISFTRPSEFGTALWYATGPEAHCEAFTNQFGTPAASDSEHDVYKNASLPFIPPALRDDPKILDRASKGPLPKLITVPDLKGSLHNHSTYSDGVHTLKQMAERARAMGLSYFGICDHSRSLAIAHGLSIDAVRDQQVEIAELNQEFATQGEPSFRILSGIESDILVDGSLDYPEEILASFDFIVASIHSKFNMSIDEATDRLVRAIENPYTTILGHPTGRLLLARKGYPVDHDRIIGACAQHSVAIELNANPYRLDLDWRWIQKAIEKGVLISINPDAHSMEGLDDVRWGVCAAQKGGLTALHCLNAKTLPEILDWLAHRKN